MLVSFVGVIKLNINCITYLLFVRLLTQILFVLIVLVLTTFTCYYLMVDVFIIMEVKKDLCLLIKYR